MAQMSESLFTMKPWPPPRVQLFPRVSFKPKKSVSISMDGNLWGLTSFLSALSLPLGAECLLGGCWTCEDLWVLAPHLETAKCQATEPLSLAWSAQDSSPATTPLLKGCKCTQKAGFMSIKLEVKRGTWESRIAYLRTNFRLLP